MAVSESEEIVRLNKNDNSRTTNNNSNSSTTKTNMEYGWTHDPIVTDTNLAEIDFEDFRNEDLAYAFSCGVS